MIQELYFVPHSKSRSLNQMNTSVTLRYDTKTEKLQLVDVFGQTKNINIDTDPDDLKLNDLLSTITIDYIKDLGFETAEETEAKATTVSANFGLGVEVEDNNYTVFLKKDVVTGIIEEQVTPEKIQSWFSAQSGIVYNAGTFELDGPFIDNRLTSFLDQAGYVPHDNDTLYHADGITLSLDITPIPSSDLNPNPSGTTNTFSVNQEWLSGFISGFLDEADVIPLSAGEGISVENIDVDGQETNVISLTAHIPSGILDVWDTQAVTDDISGLGFIQLADVPVYTAGTDIEVSDEKVISFTGHIPTGVCDVWTTEQNVADISGLGFALRTELHDTLYYADNTSLALDSDNNIFSINQQWLSTFVESFGYLTEDKDTTYTSSQSIDVTSANIISVNEVWLGEAVAPIVITNIGTEQGQTAVKNIVTKDYVSSLGFVLSDDDTDTLYFATENGGLTLTETSFAIDTDWLSGVVDTFIDNRVTSTFIAATGTKITDTKTISGIGILVESDVNGDPEIQMVSVDTDWLSGQISIYNELNNIKPQPTFAGGNGIGIIDDSTFDHDKLITLTATIPTKVSELTNDVGYITIDEDTKYFADGATIKLDGETKTFSLNNVYSRLAAGANISLSSTEEGITQIAAVDTTYTAGEGLKLEGTEFSLTAAIPSIEGLATEEYVNTVSGNIETTISTVSGTLNDAISANTENIATLSSTKADKTELPTVVSQLTNDKSYVTAAELEAIRLNIISQIANIVTVTSIDGDVSAVNQNLFVDVSATLTASTNFIGKNITVNSLSNQDSFVTFTGSEDIILNNITNSGTLDKEVNGSQVIINTPGRVTITDSTFNQKGYSGIDIGTDTTIEPPKSVLIDGVEFNGKLNRQAISIFGTADNAVVTISNCKFVNVKEAIRLSNRTNAHVTINIVNCLFTTWESGMIFCYDYTSNNEAQIEANNLFAPEKITINITNCTHGGTKILITDLDAVCGTGDENQIIYVSNKSTNIVARGAEKYPTISAN